MKIEKDKILILDDYFSKIQSRLNPIIVQANADANYHFSSDDGLYIQYIGKDKEQDKFYIIDVICDKGINYNTILFNHKKDKYEDNKVYRATFDNGKVTIRNLSNNEEYFEYKDIEYQFKNTQIQTEDEKEGSTLIAQELKTLTLLGLIYFFGFPNAAIISAALSFSRKMHILNIANDFIKLNTDGSVNHTETHKGVSNFITATNVGFNP